MDAQSTYVNIAAAADWIDVRLTDVSYAAAEVNLFEFSRVDGGRLPDAEPGSHIGLILPNGLHRQYSLISAESGPVRYTVAVKRDPNSQGGSAYMHEQLRVGERLRMTPPRNNFPLDECAERSVFIAGGIGVTPIWCMVQRLETLRRSWELHYACRRREEAAFMRELQATGKARFHLDEESEGRVLDVAGIVKGVPPESHLYCCGPTPMLTAFEAATANWPKNQIHVEYFTAKYDQDVAGGYVVELARSGREFSIPAGKTILEVLLNAGIDLDFSCEQGVCGACETRVLDGVPDHRDSILSDAERLENKTMFICCSGAKSDRLVLDL